MSNRPRRSKTPDPIVENPELESAMKAAAEAPTQALATQPDLRVENIRKANGQGDRLAVRNSAGRFTKAITEIAAKDSRQAAQFLAEKVKNEAGVELTRKQHMREALFTGMLKASQSDKGLNAAVKAFAELNTDAALNAAKEAMITAANQEVSSPVRVIMVPFIANMLHPEVIDADKPTPKKDLPSFAEVTGFTTNPKV